MKVTQAHCPYCARDLAAGEVTEIPVSVEIDEPTALELGVLALVFVAAIVCAVCWLHRRLRGINDAYDDDWDDYEAEDEP